MTRPRLGQPNVTPLRSVRSPRSNRHQLETQALFETLSDISSHLDLDKVLQAIVERAKDLIGSDCASLALKIQDKDEVQMRIAVGFIEMHPIRLKLGEGLMGLAARERKPVFVEDYLTDPRLVHTLDETVSREGIRSALSVPLILDDRVIGVLALANRTASPFKEEDAALLSTLANSAAIAIENARLYQSEREKVLQLTELNAQVRSQHTLLKRAVVIHDQLTEMVLEDRGIEAIAGRLSGLVGNPVAVQDRFFKLVACASKVDGQDEGGSKDGIYTRVPREALEDPEVKKQLSLLTEERLPVHVPARPDLGMEKSRIIAPIAAGKEILGYLAVLESHRQLEELDFLAIEHGATIFALEMMKQKITFEVEQQLKGDFLDDLIAGDYRNPKSILDRATYLGYDLSGSQRLLILEVDDFAQIVKKYQGDEKLLLSFKKRLFQVITNALQRKGIRCLMAGKGESIIVVLPAGIRVGGTTWEANQVADLMRGEIARALPGTTVSVGIGCACTSLGDYRKSNDEARKALDLARGLGTGNRTVSLDELGVYWLLFQVQDKGELRRFKERTLGPLLEYDARHNSQLVATLDAFLQNNCSLQETAQAMFLHVNTLTYRMKRIQEIGKIDLTNAEARLNAQIALKIATAIAP